LVERLLTQPLGILRKSKFLLTLNEKLTIIMTAQLINKLPDSSQYFCKNQKVHPFLTIEKTILSSVKMAGKMG